MTWINVAGLPVQALAALKKYRATVQRRGRDAIDNRCGYLIGFLKQYQDGVAVVGVPGNAVHQSRNTAALSSNGDGQHLSNGSTSQSSSGANGHNPNASGSRNVTINGAAGVPSATVASSPQVTANCTAGSGGGNAAGVRPISYLQEPVRKELEKLFESGKDKTVLEDVGLIKQLSRLGEEQALAALKNYKQASKHRRDIHNKSAYLMGILRGYIEGTTPISKAPWEGGSDEGSGGNSSTVSPAPPTTGPGGSRARGRGRGSVPAADDAERSGPSVLPKSNESLPPPPPQPQPQPPQVQPSEPPPVNVAPVAAPSVEASGPRELGGFASAPVQSQQLPPPPPPPAANPEVPLPPLSAAQSNSPLESPLLGGDGRFLGGIGPNGVSGDSAQRPYDPSNSLLYLNGGGAHQQHLRHISPHESLFGGSHLSANHPGGQPQALVGPGLLGGDFLSTGGGGAPAPVTAAAGGPGSLSNPGLFGSGLLGGDDFSTGGVGNAIPASPSSGSGPGSTSAMGSSFLSGGGSGQESPVSSDAGNDVPGALSSSATVTLAGSLSLAGSSSCNGSTDWPSSSSPGSGEGRENNYSSNGTNGVVNGVVDMLARLNLSKYVPVLAEAEVDLDALKLFDEVRAATMVGSVLRRLIFCSLPNTAGI